MLWYKAWRETRLRVLLMFAVVIFILFQVHQHVPLNRQNWASLQLQFMWMIIPLSLAGSGVRAEAPFRPVKGLQGSMYFTLSLPVNRLRLLYVRSAVGLLEAAGLVAIGCCLAVLAFPGLREQITMADGVAYALTVFVCGFSAFGLSTILATFLDQQWQGMVAMATYFVARSVTFGLNGDPTSPLARFDFFRAMGTATTLHSMPWVAMATSAAVGLACYLAAMKVELSRQY